MVDSLPTLCAKVALSIPRTTVNHSPTQLRSTQTGTRVDHQQCVFAAGFKLPSDGWMMHSKATIQSTSEKSMRLSLSTVVIRALGLEFFEKSKTVLISIITPKRSAVWVYTRNTYTPLCTWKLCWNRLSLFRDYPTRDASTRSQFARNAAVCRVRRSVHISLLRCFHHTKCHFCRDWTAATHRDQKLILEFILELALDACGLRLR